MENRTKQKLLVILGPTATGKTDLALKLASKFQGELVACDSRQVYTGLDIGTGKLPGKEVTETNSEIFRLDQNDRRNMKGYWIINGVKIWMYDVVSPRKQYTVADYVKDAQKVVEDIISRGKLPIIVGGTGLYLKALLEGLPNLEVPVDKKLRVALQKLSLQELQQKLMSISPIRWEGMNQSDRQNPRRLLRSIEIASTYGFVGKSNKLKVTTNEYNILKIGLTAPREVLYKNVDLRVLSRISQGMINEAAHLKQDGLSLKRMRQLGLEYGVLADYLEGDIKTEQELVKVMQGKIHGYVRRQITWFKKEKKVNWFDVTNKDYIKEVENLVLEWYDDR